MLGFIEPTCRQYCSERVYNWLGSSLWPHLMRSSIVDKAVELLSVLGPAGMLASGAVMIATASGAYYIISHRDGEVHVEETSTPPVISTQTDAHAEEAAAARLLEEQQRREQEEAAAARLLEEQQHREQEEAAAGLIKEQQRAQRIEALRLAKKNRDEAEAARLREEQQRKQEAQARLEQQRLLDEQNRRLQEAALALEAQREQAAREAEKPAQRVDVHALAQPQTAVAMPKQGIPKQQILVAYFRTHLSEKMKHQNPIFKKQVEQAAFADLGLPADGMVPTNPEENRRYRLTLQGLGIDI